jgi:GntR family transcriptional repressor for pyruvate dehydrogenase complex
MEARIMLEGEFARLAALNASQEEIDLLERIFNEFSNSKDINTFFVKDLELHLTIAKATHNPIMNGLMNIIGEMIYKETVRLIEVTRDARENNINNFRSIVQAIKQRNAEQAKELMVEHIRNIKVSLTR